MNLLNKLYNETCKINYKNYNYKKITNNIILIDNFFENFNLASDFFKKKDKWECIAYQGNSKIGYESIFPGWVGRSLLEKYIIDNKIVDDINSYLTVCNFVYNPESIWSLSSCGWYPHIDGIQYNNALDYICLINLNSTPITTNFFTYKNQEQCHDDKMQTEWDNYTKILTKELEEINHKNLLNCNDVKIFLNNKKDLRTKLVKKIQYMPNQAIIYPTNLFHSADITDQYFKNNPRVLLRISFSVEISKSKEKLTYF